MSRPVRIGAVRYLNSKPLIFNLEELAPRAQLHLDVPSRLADQLAAGGRRQAPLGMTRFSSSGVSFRGVRQSVG